MKHFTLATLAILVSAGSILISPSVKAESREEYCRNHQCGNYNRDRDHNYNYNRGYNGNYNNGNYNARNDNRQRHRWYDNRTHTWHYGYH